MALRGNLRDFSLPDVFQLVTFSRKTGVLRIVREDAAQGSVWFREGEVFFASSNWHSDPLGERLVNAQRISPQALSRALQIRAVEPESGRRLGRILVDQGDITESVLEAFVSEQIQDTIFDLMRWEEGEFDFEAMPDVVEEDIGLSVSIENVVMEGSRRLDEWGRIKKKIPSTDVVFKMATAPGEGTFEISLKPMEWGLLLLVDGTRSVAELATATGRTDFEVARIIYGLFSAGLLEFATEEEVVKSRAERAKREARLAEIAAEREAAEAAEKQAALDREARFAEDARRRLAAEQAAVPSAPPAAVQGQSFMHTEPVEEPMFLGSSVTAPSADDQAVLEAFMGAVLEIPKAPERPTPVPIAPEAPVQHAAWVPVEEPAFISVEHREDNDLTMVPVPSIEELLSGIAPDLIASTPPTPTTPQSEVAPSQPAAQPRDFERDLMALGLGEAPSDLLEPMSPAAVSTPQAQVPSVAENEFMFQTPAEPMSAAGGAGAASWAPEAAGAVPASTAEIAGLAADLGLPGGAPPAPATPEPIPTAPLIAEGEADFSALLDSLDVDGGSGFDADIFIDDTVEQSSGVISTDAFLEDVGMEGLGFSGGLSDELSALTGAERRQPPRPQASVHAIPDAGSVLQRDARVDRDTVLRIIDGIKNL